MREGDDMKDWIGGVAVCLVDWRGERIGSSNGGNRHKRKKERGD
jgi:hypothetical protein